MEPFQMYEALCTATGKRYDPCVIDVFMSAVEFIGKHAALVPPPRFNIARWHLFFL
jgi:hypothetical protein